MTLNYIYVNQTNSRYFPRIEHTEYISGARTYTLTPFIIIIIIILNYSIAAKGEKEEETKKKVEIFWQKKKKILFKEK